LAEGPRITDHAQDVLCFAPNGRQVLFATASDAVRLLDTETGQRIYSVNFSPDGRRIAAAYSGAVVAWQGATPAATAEGQSLRLWKRTYPNPRPDVAIVALDFISAEAYPAPFVIAITVE